MSLNPNDARALDVLRSLEAEPEVTQRELASRIDLSLWRTNYVLKALIDKGLVKVENFSQNPNKFSYMYLVTPEGIAEKYALTQRFVIRKYAEYDAIREEITELEQELSRHVP